MPHYSDDRPNQFARSPVLAALIKEQKEEEMRAVQACGRSTAKYLEEKSPVEPLWYIVDPLSSTYGMYRFHIDAFVALNNLDVVHEMMLAPEGIIEISALALFLVSVSFIGYWYEDKENNPEFIQFIVYIASKVRNATKGLKNAYKGWRSASMALTIIGAQLIWLITPLGISFGVFSCINRMLLDEMREKRKDMMKANIALYQELAQLKSLTAEQRIDFENQIKEQSRNIQRAAYLGVTVNGFFDGLYLYVGALSLVPLAPQLMIPMIVLGVIFTIACMISRLYEEYEYQHQLALTQTQNQLMLINKRLTTLFEELCREKIIMGGHASPELLDEVAKLITEFEKKRSFLIKQAKHTWFTAFLSGLQDGLTAFSATNSIVFVLFTLYLMMGLTVPPVFIVASMIIGAILLCGSIFYALRSKYNEPNNSVYETEFEAQLDELKRNIHSKHPNPYHFDDVLTLGMLTTKLALETVIAKWYEVIRSWFAGLGKGKNIISFSCNPLQELNSKGHYQDTPVMWVLSAISALFCSAVFALNALRKGLGKPSMRINDPLPPPKEKKEDFHVGKEVEMLEYPSRLSNSTRPPDLPLKNMQKDVEVPAKNSQEIKFPVCQFPDYQDTKSNIRTPKHAIYKDPSRYDSTKGSPNFFKAFNDPAQLVSLYPNDLMLSQRERFIPVQS